MASSAFSFLPVVLTFVAYYSITANYFHADDFLYLYRILNQSFFHYVTQPLGGHLLMARNLVFYLCFALFGTWAPGYFWLALLTHLLNVWLLFHAVHRFTGSRHLACVTAALWGVSPMHEGSLGWYSVYGHVMAGSVACALLYLAARWNEIDFRGLRRALAWGLLLLVGATSFGVGLGMAMVAPFVTFFLLRSPERRNCILSSLLVAALLPLLYVGAHALHSPQGMNPAGLVVSNGLSQWPTLLSLVLRLIADGVTNLLLGPSAIDRSAPLAYGLGAAAAVLWAVAMAKAQSEARMRLMGCTLLGIACYGAVALGLTARIGLVPAVQSLRYHYAGSVGLAAALALATHVVWPSPSRNASNLLLVGVLAYVAVGVGFLVGPIDHHDQARSQVAFVLQRVKNAVAQTPAGSDTYIENRRFPGVGPLLVRHTDLFPGWAGVFMIFFPDKLMDGRRVFFVTSDEPALAAAKSGRRTKYLLVDEETAMRHGWKARR